MAFNLEMYPVSYLAQYEPASASWKTRWINCDQLSFSQLQSLPACEREDILAKRNQLGIPAITYTSQYGMGCFEGMKAYPHKDGGVSIFRPDKNAQRFANSMRGLCSPVFPEDLYLSASVEFLRRNRDLGYIPAYKEKWEADNFASASAVYIRPFMNTEGAIGIGLAEEPYVVISATTVSSYFKSDNTRAVTTERIRATPHGTGYIKCASNYVISALAKREAEQAGFMEVIFLDISGRYVQEGSSCNIFFRMKDGSLVTPELGDTILPGITRLSVIELARDEGIRVEERPISIDEAQEHAIECFVTGTAAGVTPIESITHQGRETRFSSYGDLSEHLQYILKGIQYGAIADTRGWNLSID